VNGIVGGQAARGGERRGTFRVTHHATFLTFCRLLEKVHGAEAHGTLGGAAVEAGEEAVRDVVLHALLLGPHFGRAHGAAASHSPLLEFVRVLHEEHS